MPRLRRGNISSMRRAACGTRRPRTTKSDIFIWPAKAPWPRMAASRRSGDDDAKKEACSLVWRLWNCPPPHWCFCLDVLRPVWLLEIYEPTGECRGHHRGQEDHDRVLRAFDAWTESDGRPRPVWRGLVHRRELGDQDYDQSELADGRAETSRRELQHLDASERQRMDADHQQADGAVPQGLRFFDRFRPHQDEFENSRRSRRNVQN